MQEVFSHSENENCDEDEDIALKFCNEKNINHITVDKYVARNDCGTEVNSESVNKKTKVPFLHPATVYYMYNQNTNRYHHITKLIEETKNRSWIYYCN